jgi:predicted alpha-1,2-mannosidase
VTLLDPEVAGDMMQSYVTWYEQAGWASKCSWHALGDSRVMTGNFHFCAMADAWTKGLRGFDGEGAYAAMHKGSMDGEGPFTTSRCGAMALGTPPEYIELGYVPAECDKYQSASMTLEHAYNDWCVARMADALGKVDDAAYFEARSQSWKNLWNPAHGFFQARMRNSDFVEPFDPAAHDAGFTEANAWKYLWTVPHDVCGLVQTLGGAGAFEAKLDAFFDAGQFDPSNEPDFHAPYLYGAVGAHAKAVERLRAIVASAYAPTPSGLPGNDDAGATSAWLVFALVGFYPVTPGDGTYWLGSPHFDRVVIHVDPAKGIDFVIEAKGAGSGAMYVQSATLNGAPLDVPRLSHADIVKGGKLELVMGDAPSTWATTPVCP